LTKPAQGFSPKVITPITFGLLFLVPALGSVRACKGQHWPGRRTEFLSVFFPAPGGLSQDVIVASFIIQHQHQQTVDPSPIPTFVGEA